MPSLRIASETFVLSRQLLAEARSDTTRTWAARALCAGADPELFFAPRDDPATEARQMCARCLVRDQCLAYAVTAEPSGIWGGRDPHERRYLRRRLQRREPPAASRTGTAA